MRVYHLEKCPDGHLENCLLLANCPDLENCSDLRDCPDGENPIFCGLPLCADATIVSPLSVEGVPHRAASEPAVLRRSMQLAFQRRWWSLLSVALHNSIATGLDPTLDIAESTFPVASASDVWVRDPPAVSSLPARGAGLELRPRPLHSPCSSCSSLLAWFS